MSTSHNIEQRLLVSLEFLAVFPGAGDRLSALEDRELGEIFYGLKVSKHIELVV